MEIFHLGRQFLDRFRGHARIKPVGLVPLFVQKGLRSEDGVVRQNAASEQDRVSPGETVFPDVDRLGCLTTGGEVDGVSEQLGPEAADCRESADSDARRAINQVPAADTGMLFNNELRVSIGLVSEVAAGTAWEPRDPVQLADDRMPTEVQEIDILAESKVANP